LRIGYSLVKMARNKPHLGGFSSFIALNFKPGMGIAFYRFIPITNSV
jgi:hypothetical protein